MAVAGWILDIAGKGLSMRVEFNAVVLAQDVARERLSRSFRLNGWAVHGSNSLEALLAPLPPVPPGPAAPEVAANKPETVAPGPPMFRLALRKVAPDGAEEVLAAFEWDPATMPLPPGGALKAFSQSVNLAPAAVWEWTKAAAVPQLGGSDLAEIRQLLGRLHAALANRDAAELLRLQGPALREQAIATGDDPQQMLQRYGEFLRQRMGSADWSVRPWREAELRMLPMAGGRVHRITDLQGAPPLAAQAGGSIFALDPYLARIGGRWAVVR